MRQVVPLLVLAFGGFAGSFQLLARPVTLDIGSYRFIRFRVTPEQAEDTRLAGSFFTVPDSLPVEFVLLTEHNYRTGWVARGEIDTLAVLKGDAGEIDFTIDRLGDYVLILSNRGNYAQVELHADLRVYFAGTGVGYDYLPAGVTVLFVIFAFTLVIAAVVITVRKLR